MASQPEEPSETQARHGLLDEVRDFRKRFRKGSAAWALTYHLSLFGAAVLSASAALVIKTSDLDDLAAVLATLAALLTTLSSVGDFQRKWHGNRDAFYALDELLLRAADPNELSDRQVRQLLVAVIRTQRDTWSKGIEAPAVKDEIEALDDASGKT
jgi:hypothetical protein